MIFTGDDRLEDNTFYCNIPLDDDVYTYDQLVYKQMHRGGRDVRCPVVIR